VTDSTHIQQLKAMRLNCRRGLAEVETLLMAYWQQLANRSTEDVNNLHERQLFEQLLTKNDQQLFEWLLSPQQAPTEYALLIQRIRTHFLEK